MPRLIRDSWPHVGATAAARRHWPPIPDRSYATAVIIARSFEDCKSARGSIQGPLGSVPNVGLMAHEGRRNGSHDKTRSARGRERSVVVADDRPTWCCWSVRCRDRRILRCAKLRDRADQGLHRKSPSGSASFGETSAAGHRSGAGEGVDEGWPESAMAFPRSTRVR